MATAADTYYYFWPSDNVGPLATMSVVGGTADPAYLPANAVDFSSANMAKPAKLNETSGGFQGDFGSARRVDFVVLWHNADEDLSVTFSQNASASWGTPTLSEAFTIPAKRADGFTRKVWLDLRGATGYTETGLRYFLVDFGGSPANSVPVGMKILLFSRVRQLSRDFQWGVKDTEHQIGIVAKTAAGSRWGYDLTSAPRMLTGNGLITDADAEAVREWFRACAGTIKPTVIIPEPMVNDAWLVYWSPNGFSIEAPSLAVSRHENTRPFVDANAVTIQFEEVAIGDREWD